MLQLEGSMQFPYIQFKGAYINYLISKLLTPTIMFMFNATIKTAVSAFLNLKDQAIHCNLIWFTTLIKQLEWSGKVYHCYLLKGITCMNFLV